MNTSTEGIPVEALALRRRRRRRLIAGVLCLLLAVGLFVQFGQSPSVALGVLSSQITDDGQQVSTGDVSASPSLAGQMTVVEGRNSTGVATTSSRGSGWTWPRDSVAIFCESDHLLMQRVGLALFEGLKKTEEFPQIFYVPRGERLPPGQEIPDIFITLSMPEYTESGLPVAKRYDLKLVTKVGREFAHGNSTNITNTTPPVVQFQSVIRTDYTAKQTGLETSGAQYTAVSNDIVKSLQKSILEIFKKDEDLQLPAREMIPEFYPEYQPPPDLGFLTTLHAQSKCSGPRFMQSTSAAWTFTSELTNEELHDLIDVPLLADGWKGHDVLARADAKGRYYGAWNRGAEELYVHSSGNSGHMSSSAPAVEGPEIYTVIYTKTMTADETKQAFLALLDRPFHESMLLPFVNWWYYGKEKLVAYFEEHRPTTAEAYRLLAEWKLNAKDTTGAQKLILQGQAIDRLLTKGEKRSTFEELAKKAGLEKLPERLDPAVIASLGMPDIRDQKEFELTCASGEQVVLWVHSSDQEQTLMKITAQKKRSGAWSFTRDVMTIHDHGSSYMSTGAEENKLEKPFTMSVGWNDLHFDLQVTRTDNPQQVRIRLTRRK
ncbi:hypothetical protein GC163_18935 [bacterium]|nr:hypothetical protein [bacterium]